MTEPLDLAAVLARHRENVREGGDQLHVQHLMCTRARQSAADVPALVAEVKDLRAKLAAKEAS